MKNYDITEVPELYGVVYMLTNPLGERYIGSTVDLRQRMCEYRCGGHSLIGESILKYGFENHTLSILAKNILEKNLLAREYKFQKEIDPELNLRTVNANGRVRHAESSKQKMSAAMKGENNPNFGKTPSPETRAKQSAATKGIPKPPEHVAKVQKANREFYYRKNHERDKKIISMRKKGKTLQAIADCVGLSSGHVYHICRRHQVEIPEKVLAAQQLRKQKRDERVISMRKKGKTHQAIADCIGLPRNHVGRICRQHHAEIMKVLVVQPRNHKRDEKIISMRKKGKSYEEIAERFGILKGRVQQICQQHQVEIPENVLTTQQLRKQKRDKKIIVMRKKGKTHQAIADCVGLSRGGVQRICQQHQVEIPENLTTQQLRKQKRDKKILSLRKKGMTLQAIADRVGLSIGSVHRIC